MLLAATYYWEDALVLAGVLTPLLVLGWWLLTGPLAQRPPRVLTCAVCYSTTGTISPARWGYPASHAACRSLLRRHPEVA